MASTRPIVLITETLDDQCAAWLGERAEVVWCPHDDAGKLAQWLPRADGLVVRTYTLVTDAFLAGAPKLRVIGRAGVGLDNIDVPACRRRGIEVVFTPDANTQAVVEYVFGLMLDVLRPRTAMPSAITPAIFHEMRKTQVGAQLDQLTLGVLGFGRIGKRIGAVARTIGMKLLVNDILPEQALRQSVDYPFEFVDKARLYGESDILTIHVDGRRENSRMIDAAALRQLKPSCLLINAARGMLVDNNALASWAKANPASHVVLDVHDPEPTPADYPLAGIPNVRLLPHLASRTNEALANMSWVVRDIVTVLQGGKAMYPAP